MRLAALAAALMFLPACAGVKKRIVTQEVMIRIYPVSQPNIVHVMKALTTEHGGRKDVFVRYPLSSIEESARPLELRAFVLQIEKGLGVTAESWWADPGLDGFWVRLKPK